MNSSQTVADRPQRRRWPLAEKRRIVELTMQHGASVRSVAQEYRIHVTTVSHWKTMYQNGLFDKSQTPLRSKKNVFADFLPVMVDMPTSLPTSGPLLIDITLPNGILMHIESASFDVTTFISFVAKI